MATKIGFQDGIEAVRQRLNEIDPGKAGYDKQAQTLKTLKAGHNEGLDRLKALEAKVDALPFPFQVS